MNKTQKTMLTLSLMVAALMQALDTTIANVALPHIQGSLSASVDEINWVLTSYITAAAIATLPTGWLSEKFGSKKIFTFAIAGFTVSSVLCGLSLSIEEIVLFRLLQGIFGASLIPLSQATLLDINPPEKHGSAMALWGVGVMVGPIIGPSLGGYLTDNYSWRWVFYINVPFGILSFLGILSFGQDSEKKSTPFDFVGFSLFAIFIASLQLLLDRGNQLDWLDSTEIKIYLFIMLSTLWMFCYYITWAKNPFISLGVFKDRNFCAGLILMFLVGIILLATMSLLPPLLQNLANYPVVTVGIVMVPRGIGTMLVMMIVGKLLERKVDPRLLIFLGLGLTSFSLWEMTSINLSVTKWIIVKTGFIQGLGLGFTFVPLTTIAFSTLNPIYRVEASGLFTLLRNIGSSIGISIVSTLLSRHTQLNHSILSEHINIFNIHHIRNLLSTGTSKIGKELAAVIIDSSINIQAQMISYLNCFKLMMIIVVISIPLVLLLKNNKRLEGKKDSHLVAFE
jgi:DHA2 family multidrug resistance protein